MKIITLNIWGGAVKEPLLDFFRRYADIDIFLLQEVFFNGTERTLSGFGIGRREARIYHDIQSVLGGHAGYFAAAEPDEWGLAAFVKKRIPVLANGDVFVHRWKGALAGKDGTTLGKNLQYLEVRDDSGEAMLISNFHGLWNDKGKGDSDERLKQSDSIMRFFDRYKGWKTVLMGDFNLNPDTESIAILERGFRNLISEHGISSTRTSFYEKDNKFADYAFVSHDVPVKAFKVLPEEVSDHAPLLLEI